MVVMLLSCFAMPAVCAQESENETGEVAECKTGNIDYTVPFNGDYAGIRYHNVFARFVPAKDNAEGFWFYVYEKGEIQPQNAEVKKAYAHFPTYIAVRAYAQDEQEKIRAKFWDITESGVTIVPAKSDKIFIPYYFTANSEEQSAVVYYAHEGFETVILTGFLSGNELARFEVGVLPQKSCGKESVDFEEMATSFPRL